MPDTLILFGALAIGIERWTEIWMNLMKPMMGTVPETENGKQWWLRFVAMTIGVSSGIFVAWIGNLDFFAAVLPGVDIKNGWWLSGAFMGLGAAPAHEVIKYVEEKKNKGKAEKTWARQQAGMES